MNCRKTEDTMMLIGGALLGGAALYFLDPNSGQRRRQRIVAAAEGAFDDARGRAKHLVSHLGRHTSDAHHSAAAYAQHLADQAHDIAADLTARAKKNLPDAGGAYDSGRHWGEKWFGRARGAVADAHSAAHGYANDAAGHAAAAAHDYASHLQNTASKLWNRARGLVADVPDIAADHVQHVRDDLSDRSDAWRRRAAKHVSRASHRAQSWLGHEEHEGFGTGTVLTTAVGTAAVGVGLMYFLDPKLGRSRRARVGDMAASTISRTGKTMRGIGKDLANRFHGKAHQAQAMAARYISRARIDSEQLIRQIRAEIGHLSARVNQVQFMADGDGTVTVTGEVGRSEVDGLLAILHRVPGVEHVINRLRVSDGSVDYRTSAANSANG